MELVFNKNDMIKFVTYYDNKPPGKCHNTYEEEFAEWLTLQKTTHNNNYIKCPDCGGKLTVIKEFLCTNRNCVSYMLQ